MYNRVASYSTNSVDQLVDPEIYFEVSPNPFADEIVIESEQQDQIEILSFEGKMVLFFVITPGETRLNTRSIQQGTYLLKSRYTNTTYKLIKL